MLARNLNCLKYFNCRMLEEFEKMFKDDVATNRALSKYGGEHILDKSGGENVKILTHCNTGSLASAGYGTALGMSFCKFLTPYHTMPPFNVP